MPPVPADENAPPHPTIVGVADIADRLNANRATVDAWRHRGLLPEPDWTIGGRPAWKWSKVEKWAKETGRFSR
jgi:hypothetical protein